MGGNPGLDSEQMYGYNNGLIRSQSSPMAGNVVCNVYEYNEYGDWQSETVTPIQDFSATAIFSVDHLETGSSPVRQMD